MLDKFGQVNYSQDMSVMESTRQTDLNLNRGRYTKKHLQVPL